MDVSYERAHKLLSGIVVARHHDKKKNRGKGLGSSEKKERKKENEKNQAEMYILKRSSKADDSSSNETPRSNRMNFHHQPHQAVSGIIISRLACFEDIVILFGRSRDKFLFE